MWTKEPVLFITIGGMALVQALLGVYTAFVGPLSPEKTAAVTGLATIVLAILARMQVTPVATLPPGVAGQIAAAKTTQEVDK